MKSTLYYIFSILGAAALITGSGAPTSAEPTQPTSETITSEASLFSNDAPLAIDPQADSLTSNGVTSKSQDVAATKQPATELPAPGTALTTAAALQSEEPRSTPSKALSTEVETQESVVAQAIDPGRATLSGPSYVAVGANIGFGGGTALGRESFVITSKIGLTNRFSARPGLVVNGSPTILLPVTIDFPVRSVIDGRIGIAPFVGGGIAISTRGGSEVRALAVGGIDIPLSERLTATASANAAFFNRTEIGVILGIGYNF